MSISGVGPDAPTVTNASGAKQSSSPYASHLLPATAVLHVAKILKYGADKYGNDNWRGLSPRELLDHTLTHLLAYFAGDESDDHLGHATCRCIMALEIHLGGKPRAT